MAGTPAPSSFTTRLTTRPDVGVKTEQDLKSLAQEYQRALDLRPETFQRVVRYCYHSYFDADGKVIPGGFTFERRTVLMALLNEAQRLSRENTHKSYGARLLGNIETEMNAINPPSQTDT